MNTDELETFLLLSKVKNFTIASKQLFIAQSTVTNRIFELEREVGKKLFSRDAKTVTLTEEGKIFLKYAERILELKNSSVAELSAYGSYRNNLAVGAINATYEAYVKPLLDECLKKSKDTSVKIVLGHSIDLVQLLQDNVLDLVFSAMPLKRAGYVCEIYDSDRLVLVTGKGKNGFPNGITKADLTEIPYFMCSFAQSEVGQFISSLFPKNYVFKLEVDSSSKLLPYLCEGIGYSFLPFKLVQKQLESGELEEVSLTDFVVPDMNVYLIYKQGFDPKSFLKYKH